MDPAAAAAAAAASSTTTTAAAAAAATTGYGGEVVDEKRFVRMKLPFVHGKLRASNLATALSDFVSDSLVCPQDFQVLRRGCVCVCVCVWSCVCLCWCVGW